MLLSAAIAISAATCTVRTLRVMPTYTAMQETCVIQRQGQRPQRKTTVFRVQHPNHSNGSVPDDFVIPVGDR
ncbi:MAG: hypothetical protein ACRC62_20380 [Microcoleus sp.]